MPTNLNQNEILVTPELQSILNEINLPFSIESNEEKNSFSVSGESGGLQPEEYLLKIPALPINNLGDAEFRKTYGVRCAFYAGAMANGIASAEMVIALGKAGLMGSFGAAGLVRSKLEAVVDQIQSALPKRSLCL